MSINLSLLWRIAFIIVEIYHNRSHVWDETPLWADAILSTMNLLFLALAGVLNIYNWLSFIYTLRNYDHQAKLRKQTYLRLLNYAIPILSLLMIFTYWAWFTIACSGSSESLYGTANDVIDSWSWILFLSLGISFLIIGRKLKQELRIWNEDIEDKTRGKINFAMHVLSFPFIVRGIYIIVKLLVNINSQLTDSIRDNTWLSPIVTFLFILIADIVPITSQLASMLVVIDDGHQNNIEGSEQNSDSLISADSIINPTENWSSTFNFLNRPDDEFMSARRMTSKENAFQIRKSTDFESSN